MEIDKDTTMEEELFQQLFQQLTMCKRSIIDCGSALIEMAVRKPFCDHLTIAKAIPDTPFLKPSVSHRMHTTGVDPPKDIVTHANSILEQDEIRHAAPASMNVSALERDLKEAQEACRDAERIADDREEKLATLEETLKETQDRLASSERECLETKEKYEFQVEVSQRVARHYQSLQSSVSQFKELYQSLMTSMDQSRELFAQTEHKIDELEEQRRRMEASIQSRRQKLEERESLVRSLERTSADAMAQASAHETRTVELQQQLEALNARVLESEQQQQVLGRENVRLQDILKKQTSLLQKEQDTVSTLTNSLNSIQDIQSLQEPPPVAASLEKESETTDLRARIAILQVQIEELSQKRAESLAAHRSLTESITKRCEDSEEQLQKSQRRLQELEQENAELRALITRKSAVPTSSLQSRSTSSPFSSSIQRSKANSSNQTPPPSRKHSLPTSSPAPSAASRSSRNFMSVDDEIEVFDPDDEDSIRHLVSSTNASGSDVHPPRSSGLNLLPESSYELLQYRGLKCCGEAAVGLTVTCSVCQELFHVNCTEGVRSGKSLGKNKKFVCYACDPFSKPPKARKPKLQMR